MSNCSQGSVILGIDPGLTKTGWGIINKIGDEVRYIDCGVIKTDVSSEMGQRLAKIFNAIRDVLATYNPQSIAMEEVFVNINPKTSEKLIMARTAGFLAVALSGFVIRAFRPNEIKKHITGAGHADKTLIYAMVKKMLGIEIEIDNKTKTLDSIDALAVALCSALHTPPAENQESELVA
ncbi:MAG: crossover junction endodeoxyribonuclease RuvC [Holosporales bacterium]|jgi:crossover junction endodeoxyribonuclease RuvC|nr:crossover junction endodeoxyribonuclease RuvC [Holosporales bacterium]